MSSAPPSPRSPGVCVVVSGFLRALSLSPSLCLCLYVLGLFNPVAYSGRPVVYTEFFFFLCASPDLALQPMRLGPLVGLGAIGTAV